LRKKFIFSTIFGREKKGGGAQGRRFPSTAIKRKKAALYLFLQRKEGGEEGEKAPKNLLIRKRGGESSFHYLLCREKEKIQSRLLISSWKKRRKKGKRSPFPKRRGGKALSKRGTARKRKGTDFLDFEKKKGRRGKRNIKEAVASLRTGRRKDVFSEEEEKRKRKREIGRKGDLHTILAELKKKSPSLPLPEERRGKGKRENKSQTVVLFLSSNRGKRSLYH